MSVHGCVSFKCDCGRAVQLSPGLKASHLLCSKCKRKIEILPPEPEAEPEPEAAESAQA